MAPLHPSRLGICSWSLRPGSVETLIEKTNRIGASSLQLALEPLRSEPSRWVDCGAKLRDAGIEILSGMIEAAGEDYATPATIRETGGIVPDTTWEANRRRVEGAGRLAAALGLARISLHAGFIPEDPSSAKYGVLVKRLRWIADHLAGAAGAVVLLETGQETAATLGAFLDAVDRPNLGVNFDPANMLLYDMGDPVASLTALLPRVHQVHVKDAVRPRRAGAWGTEVVVGTGDVDWPAFLSTLLASDFEGPLIVEREAGDDRVADLGAALAFLSRTLEGIG